MSLNESKMRRLAFVRFLSEKAREESNKSQPNPSASILTFHDAVELYLYLSAEHLGISKPKSIGFMEYWNRLSEALDDGETLSHKESMERLNRARRNLKHAGNRPHEEDVLSFRVAVVEFLTENTPKIFGIEYEEITLSRMVEFDETRRFLQKAESLAAEGNHRESIVKSALAFDALKREVRNNYRNWGGFRPFASHVSHRSPSRRSRITGQRAFGGHSMDRDVGQAIQTIQSDISSLSEAVEIHSKAINDTMQAVEKMSRDFQVIGMGIDFLEYSRFQRITPTIIHSMGEEEMETTGKVDEEFQNEEFGSFCTNFVLDSALKLQEMVLDKPQA